MLRSSGGRPTHGTGTLMTTDKVHGKNRRSLSHVINVPIPSIPTLFQPRGASLPQPKTLDSSCGGQRVSYAPATLSPAENRLFLARRYEAVLSPLRHRHDLGASIHKPEHAFASAGRAPLWPGHMAM